MPYNEHLTLVEAARRTPGHPSANAVWRWCRKGVLSRSGQRIRLDHVRVGGRIFTTAQKLERFFTAVAESDREHFRQDLIDRHAHHTDCSLAPGNLDERQPEMLRVPHE